MTNEWHTIESAEGYIAVVSLDEAVLEDSIACLRSSPADFTQYSNTYISCKVSAVLAVGLLFRKRFADLLGRLIKN